MTRLPIASDAAPMAEINITPFTDVLLVLLVIFMVLATLVIPPGFERSLASTGEWHKPVAAHHMLSISIDRHGRILLGTEPTDARRIYADLARVARRDASIHISLEADARAPYGLVIRVVDAAQAAGIHDVDFVSD